MIKKHTIDLHIISLVYWRLRLLLLLLLLLGAEEAALSGGSWGYLAPLLLQLLQL